NTASKEGLTPFSKQWNRRVENLARDPSDATLGRADKVSARTAFREPGKASELLHTVVNTFPILEPTILPFRTAAAAVPREVTRRTPLAPIIKSWREDFAKGGAE